MYLRFVSVKKTGKRRIRIPSGEFKRRRDSIDKDEFFWQRRADERGEGRTINLTFCRESSTQRYEDEYPRQSEPFIDNELNLHRSGESYSSTNSAKTVRNKTIILKRRNELNHSTWGGSINLLVIDNINSAYWLSK